MHTSSGQEPVHSADSIPAIRRSARLSFTAAAIEYCCARAKTDILVRIIGGPATTWWSTRCPRERALRFLRSLSMIDR